MVSLYSLQLCTLVIAIFNTVVQRYFHRMVIAIHIKLWKKELRYVHKHFTLYVLDIEMAFTILLYCNCIVALQEELHSPTISTFPPPFTFYAGFPSKNILACPVDQELSYNDLLFRSQCLCSVPPYWSPQPAASTGICSTAPDGTMKLHPIATL